MGVDCVFWIKLAAGTSAAACMQQICDELLANGCPMVPTEDEIDSDAQITEMLGYKLYCTPTDEEAAAAILDAHTRRVSPNWPSEGCIKITPSHFAYCYLNVDEDLPGWLSLHDGCRRHLNPDYQAAVIAWLKRTTGMARVFVQGDCQADPTE